eukprot:5872128-Alexandrium_andersonii.AAC.1
MNQTERGKLLLRQQGEAYARHVARMRPQPPPPPTAGSGSHGPGAWTWTPGSTGGGGSAPAPPQPPPAARWSTADAGPQLPTHHAVDGRNSVGLRL